MNTSQEIQKQESGWVTYTGDPATLPPENVMVVAACTLREGGQTAYRITSRPFLEAQRATMGGFIIRWFPIPAQEQAETTKNEPTACPAILDPTKDIPEGGWKEQTYYLVWVSLFPSNMAHEAILHIGFLNADGAPGGYSYVWAAGYEDHERVNRRMRVIVKRELFTKDRDYANVPEALRGRPWGVPAGGV